MYAILHLIAYLPQNVLDTDDSLKGFYPITLRWVYLEFSKPISMPLDFLNVFPRDRVGQCIRLALFSCLKSFGIS